MSNDPKELEKRVQELEEELKQLRAGQDSPSRQRTRRVQFQFTEEAYQYLQAEAQRNNTSMADVIRDALSKKKWVDETLEEGKLLVQEKGEVRRVVNL